MLDFHLFMRANTLFSELGNALDVYITTPGEDTELADAVCQFCIFTKKSCLNKLALSCYNEMHNGIMRVACWLPQLYGSE